MIDHVWSVLCSRSVIDSSSNNISLIEVLEQLSIRRMPPGADEEGVVPIQCELVTLWARADEEEPATGRGRITLVRPSGLAMPSQEFEIDLTRVQRTRHRARMNGVPVSEAGRYTFRIEFSTADGDTWDEVARVPLYVSFVPPESPAGLEPQRATAD
jgi:hypothetical protein